MTATPTTTWEPMGSSMTQIRGLRARLIEDLGEAMERAYRLAIEAKKAQLDEAARVKRGLRPDARSMTVISGRGGA